MCRERVKDTETVRQIQRKCETDRQTDRETERDRQREIDTHTHSTDINLKRKI